MPFAGEVVIVGISGDECHHWHSVWLPHRNTPIFFHGDNPALKGPEGGREVAKSSCIPGDTDREETISLLGTLYSR